MTAVVKVGNHLPGGRLTAIAVPGAERMVIERGEGAYIWDQRDTRYLDLLMGSGAVLLGHGHPKVVEAVRRQVARGTTFYAPTQPALELAERIVGHYPGAQTLQYCSTGSEATLFALRLARSATGRETVLKLEGGFHGSNDYAMMSAYPTGPANYPRSEPSSLGIPRAVQATVVVAPYNDLERCRQFADDFGEDLAAILVEPYQRNIPPHTGFLAGLRQLADSYRACLVFDEIVTGFRVGLGGAAALCGVTPDLATLGKAIGGGLPLAAVVGRDEVVGLASPDRGADGFAYCSGTLSGNPLAASAGLAALDVLEQPGSFEQLFATGDRMRAGLAQAFADNAVPAQSFGVGPLFRVLPTPMPVTDYRSAATGDMGLLRVLAAGLLDRGVYFTGDKGYLSLAHTDTDVDTTAAAVHGVLKAHTG